MKKLPKIFCILLGALILLVVGSIIIHNVFQSIEGGNEKTREIAEGIWVIFMAIGTSLILKVSGSFGTGNKHEMYDITPTIVEAAGLLEKHRLQDTTTLLESIKSNFPYWILAPYPNTDSRWFILSAPSGRWVAYIHAQLPFSFVNEEQSPDLFLKHFGDGHYILVHDKNIKQFKVDRSVVESTMGPHMNPEAYPSTLDQAFSMKEFLDITR